MLKKLLKIINEHGGTWSMRKKQGLPENNTIIIVSIENFFKEAPLNGYNFAANANFGDTEFYRLFNKIKRKESVQDVWIEIHDYDPDEDEYPYAETCYISTIAKEEDLWKWFGDRAFPSTISILKVSKGEFSPINEGYTVFSCGGIRTSNH
jgi:hypothetical protein